MNRFINNKIIALACIQLVFACCFSVAGQEDETPVFSPDVLGNEELFRPALAKRFSKLETVFYHFDGHVVFGLFRKKESDMYLFVLLPAVGGKVSVTLNKKNIKLENTAEFRLASEVYHDGKPRGYDYSKTTSAIVGRWISIKQEDTLEIKGNIFHPVQRKIFANYNPNNQVISWLLPKDKLDNSTKK